MGNSLLFQNSGKKITGGIPAMREGTFLAWQMGIRKTALGGYKVNGWWQDWKCRLAAEDPK